MIYIAIILLLSGVLFIILAHCWFIVNTKEEHYDSMGAAINFDQPFSLGSILLSIGLFLAGLLQWYWCVLLCISLIIFGNFYKWLILDKIIELFRVHNSTKKSKQN